MVSILSGILRVAKGLDYSHKSRIRAIRASFTKKEIQFDCLAKKSSVRKEFSSTDKKGNLLRRNFKRELIFKVYSVEEFTGLS